MDEPGCVYLSGPLQRRLVEAVLARHPRKSFGFLIADRSLRRPVDFILFEQNVRNDEQWRGEFETYGRYFTDHDDAGFVADPGEALRVQQSLIRSGMFEAAVFHSHRRHPANFSLIDYEMHRARFDGLWHLIISMRNPLLPQVRAFTPKATGVDELEIHTADDCPRQAGTGLEYQCMI